MTNQSEKSYPFIRVTLLFGLISVMIGLVLCGYIFVDNYIQRYNYEHYGRLMTRNYSYSDILLMTTIVLSPYFLLLGGMMALKKVTWQGKCWRNRATYGQILKYNAITISIFIILILICNPTSQKSFSDFIAIMVAFFVFVMVSGFCAGFILPKGEK